MNLFPQHVQRAPGHRGDMSPCLVPGDRRERQADLAERGNGLAPGVAVLPGDTDMARPDQRLESAGNTIRYITVERSASYDLLMAVLADRQRVAVGELSEWREDVADGVGPAIVLLEVPRDWGRSTVLEWLAD